MLRGVIPLSLGTFITLQLKAQGLTVRAFAKQRLGMTSSYVSKVLKGSLPVPYDRIGHWSVALGLRGEEAAAFRELALLALSPVEVQQLVAELRRDLEKRSRRMMRR